MGGVGQEEMNRGRIGGEKSVCFRIYDCQPNIIDQCKSRLIDRHKLDDSQVARDQLPESIVGEHNAVQVRSIQFWTPNGNWGNVSIMR